MVQKVGFTAIINYFDLDMTPYGLFSIDNYKINTLRASNFTFKVIWPKKCLKLPKISNFSIKNCQNKPKVHRK